MASKTLEKQNKTIIPSFYDNQTIELATLLPLYENKTIELATLLPLYDNKTVELATLVQFFPTWLIPIKPLSDNYQPIREIPPVSKQTKGVSHLCSNIGQIFTRA